MSIFSNHEQNDNPPLDIHPAAERLLRNLICYAARDQNKPAEKLPADSDIKLKAIGYE